ncbi:MAG TPA: hypothetical protein VM100_11930 [Longimicrobiales bacterium]|nr:hypothetical protein [Longimicrobiales bacterium]
MVLFAIYLVLVIALPILLSGLVGLRSLPNGAACPNCAQDTIPLLSQSVRLAQRVYNDFPLQHRWCPTCEWDGYAHIATSRVSLPLFIEPPGRRTQQLRKLEIGGREWRVMLESWRERGRCFGRLNFIGPSGKLWSDPLPAFNAPTQHEVLSQALALSDRLLAYRLREVISG